LPGGVAGGLPGACVGTARRVAGDVEWAFGVPADECAFGVPADECALGLPAECAFGVDDDFMLGTALVPAVPSGASRSTTAFRTVPPVPAE